MKVQRCPSCGARYNVQRLDAGATFSCRRCDGLVTVGEAVEAQKRTSLGLVIAGVLMIGVVFLAANPRYGVASLRWPWEQFQHAESLLVRATYVLWTFAGLVALIGGLIPAARGRGLLLAPLVAWLLVLTTSGDQAGFAVTTDRSLAWLLGLIALTAGFELLRGGRAGRPTPWLLLAGAVCIVWWHANGFQEGGRSQLEVLADHLGYALQGRLDELEGRYLWELLAVYWAILVACGLGLAALLGLRHRVVGLVGVMLLAIALLLPMAVALGEGLANVGTFEEAMSRITGSLATMLVQEGVALWALGAWTIADLVRTRGGAA